MGTGFAQETRPVNDGTCWQTEAIATWSRCLCRIGFRWASYRPIPMKSYLITYRIPMNVLLDADSVIVERYVHGDHPLAKISELHGE